MGSFLTVVLVLSGIAIIGLVLIQHGKGADMGASFGSGASQTIFGSAGSGNVLTRSTTWLAVVFFAACLGLAWMARKQADSSVEVDALLSSPAAANTALESKPEPAATDAPVAQQQASDVPAPAAAAETAPTTVEQDAQKPQN